MRLFQILGDQVSIVKDGQFYNDTVENYLKDGGVIEKDGEKISIAVHDTQQNYCEVNGKVVKYPVEFFEKIIDDIDTLLAKKAEREYVEPSLDELKQAKLLQIDAWTANKITGGFVSITSGEAVTYDSDKDTQLTMQGIALNVNTALFAEKYPNGCPVRGYAEGASEKTVYWLNADQVMAWCADLSIHIGNCKQLGWQKQAEVAAATTKEELESIVLE